MKTHAQKIGPAWQTRKHLISSKKLALIIMASSMASTLMLKILPSELFIALVISTFTVWYFYPQISQFFSSLRAKSATEKPLLHKNPKISINNIKHFKHSLHANKQLSPRNRFSLTESANSEHETNNVLTFPRKPASGRKGN